MTNVENEGEKDCLCCSEVTSLKNSSSKLNTESLLISISLKLSLSLYTRWRPNLVCKIPVYPNSYFFTSRLAISSKLTISQTIFCLYFLYYYQLNNNLCRNVHVSYFWSIILNCEHLSDSSMWFQIWIAVSNDNCCIFVWISIWQT